MGLANVPWEWDYPMCPENKTIQCTLGMGLANVPGNTLIPRAHWIVPFPGLIGESHSQGTLPLEWDYQICLGNGTSQCAQGMGLSNVPWEWD